MLSTALRYAIVWIERGKEEIGRQFLTLLKAMEIVSSGVSSIGSEPMKTPPRPALADAEAYSEEDIPLTMLGNTDQESKKNAANNDKEADENGALEDFWSDKLCMFIAQ